MPNPEKRNRANLQIIPEFIYWEAQDAQEQAFARQENRPGSLKPNWNLRSLRIIPEIMRNMAILRRIGGIWNNLGKELLYKGLQLNLSFLMSVIKRSKSPVERQNIRNLAPFWKIVVKIRSLMHFWRKDLTIATWKPTKSAMNAKLCTKGSPTYKRKSWRPKLSIRMKNANYLKISQNCKSSLITWQIMQIWPGSWRKNLIS